MLKKMLNDYKNDKNISDPEVISSLNKYELFNEKGELLLPVIHANNANELYRKSRSISKKVADYLVKNINFGMITDHYPAITKEQAMIIIYHEVMWDILELMEERGLLTKPIAFTNPHQAKESDLKDLIFIVEE
jgi:ribulose 1,5-bisphosphate carboxylase large subunit-like protein